MDASLTDLFRGLCALADAPVDAASFEAAAARLGWRVERNAYAPEGTTCLEVALPFDPPMLIAVFSPEQCGAGTALFVLMENGDQSDDHYLPTRSEFDEAFETARRQIAGTSGAPAWEGTYDSVVAAGTFRYALWPRREWFVALLQHHEGDGNNGHGPTLDLRLVPRQANGGPPDFPLVTNLIF